MRRIIATAVLSLAASASLVAVTSDPAAADPGAESAFVAATNNLRASQGLGSLEVSGELTAKARAWAQHMANGGCGGANICHSNLSDGISSDWRRLGENVGTGGSVDAIHQALVNSPGHYANLVDPGFRLVGVGVLNINGTLWVAEVFMEPASQPAPSSPVPAAGTPSSSGGAPTVNEPAPAPRRLRRRRPRPRAGSRSTSTACACSRTADATGSGATRTGRPPPRGSGPAGSRW